MKYKLIIFVLSALIVIQFFLSFKTKSVDLDYLKREYEKHQEKIDGLYIDLSKTKADIQRFKLQLNEKDSIINIANHRELDSLFTDFFKRAR